MTSRSNQTNNPKYKKDKSGSSSIWGGRFERKPHDIMDQINPSIDFDKRFFRQDIRGSKAHAEMLSVQKIITKSDKDKIIHGLDQIEREIDEGTFKFSRELEDIHMNIEARLASLVGDAAGRLHTGRSRNDQVATDFKLWIRDTIDTLDQQLMSLQAALIDLADQNFNQVMPGFTHLQVAQPVSFGHHLLAYVEMLGRDRTRFQDGRARLNECPLGSAALAGTSFPIDRNMTRFNKSEEPQIQVQFSHPGTNDPFTGCVVFICGGFFRMYYHTPGNDSAEIEFPVVNQTMPGDGDEDSGGLIGGVTDSVPGFGLLAGVGSLAMAAVAASRTSRED